jgi:hypothetical protein
MNENTTATTTGANTDPSTGHSNARPTTPRRSTAFVAGAGALCAVAVAGVVGGILLAFGPSASAHSAHTPVAPPAHHAAVAPITPTHPVSPAHPVQPNIPAPAPVTPSAAVATLQSQLGQLNYYEGADNGIMNHQTVQAIEYLQRDAGLPQSGQLNAATDAALTHLLIAGNNQMAG